MMLFAPGASSPPSQTNHLIRRMKGRCHEPGRGKGRVWGQELLKRPGCDLLNLYLFQVDMSRRALGGDPTGSPMSQDGKNEAQSSLKRAQMHGLASGIF